MSFMKRKFDDFTFLLGLLHWLGLSGNHHLPNFKFPASLLISVILLLTFIKFQGLAHKSIDNNMMNIHDYQIKHYRYT